MSVPHLLIDGDGAILLDTGFPGDRRQIEHTLAQCGVGPADVRAIVLTHGHIDHAGNVAWAKQWSGAPVYAHPLEQRHIDGEYPYSGAARVCGFLEAIGRTVTQYQPAGIDVPLHDGDTLPFWGGLRVVHLPGHTLGHCGFYSERHDLLFSGDLWVRFMMRTQMSPPIFTAAPKLLQMNASRKNFSSPSFNEMELTIHFPCTHFKPASMILNLEESIIIGILAISGSDCNKFKKVVIAFSPSSRASSMFTSSTCAPPSTCCRATDKASS